MSRLPTDEEISLKAIAFDRKHFVDGVDPAPDVIVKRHEQSRNDSKLITRLQPRFISALAFFEGYKQACTDTPTFDERSTREVLRLVKDKLEKVDSNQSGWATRYHVLRVFDEVVASLHERDPKNIGIVIKPPPPPPPAAAPPIDDPYVWDGECCRYRTRVNRFGVVEYEADVGGTTAWYAAQDTSSVQCEARKFAVIALAVRLDAYEETIAPIREALTQAEAERLAMKEERDRALAQVRAWEVRTGETQPRIVQAKLEKDKPIANDDLNTARNWFLNDEAGSFTAIKEDFPACARFISVLIAATDKPTKPIANDELRTGIDDELARVAADYANEFKNVRRVSHDIDLVRDAVKQSRHKCNEWDTIARSFVNGALWQSARMENAAGEDPPNVHELQAENERLRVAWRDELIAKQNAEERAHAAEQQISRDRTPLPTPIVFRDDNERDFWDDVIHGLNRRTEQPLRDMALAADEIIEERRARMSTEPSDELLMKAVAYTNKETGHSNPILSDLVELRNALKMDYRNRGGWSVVACSYIAGALAK